MQKIKSVLTITETEASIARAKLEKTVDEPENIVDVLKENEINERTSGKDSKRST